MKNSGSGRSTPVRFRESRRPGAPVAEFLNIDLDIRSRSSLAALREAWPWAQQPLGLNGKPNTHWLILSPRGNPRSAETAARLLLRHVESLGAEGRLSWTQAS